MKSIHVSSTAMWHAPVTGVLVFVLACLGIATRQVDSLASFWPANAVLLGVLLRWPVTARWRTWVAAAIGYVAADLAMAGTFERSLWLAAANLTGVALGVAVYTRVARGDAHTSGSRAVLGLFLMSLAGAGGAAIVGAFMAPHNLDPRWYVEVGFWFANEFTNYMLILPLLLLIPVPETVRRHMGLRLRRDSVADLAPPVLALLFSLAGSALIGGPGAIAFPVPALIWCCLMFSPWVIAILNFLVGIFFLVASTSGWLALGTTDTDSWEIISLRFGVALLLLGPLTLSEIERDRRYALVELGELANLDALTAVMNRRAFDQGAAEVLERAWRGGKPVALLMMDVDHFKKVNDTHGHLAGDRVLTRLASIVSIVLPSNAVVGRVGGEEFAALVPGLDHCQAYQLADGIRARIEAESSTGGPYHTLGATVSIGIAWEVCTKESTLKDLKESADRALYEAKSFGRNHVVLSATPGDRVNPEVAHA